MARGKYRRRREAQAARAASVPPAPKRGDGYNDPRLLDRMGGLAFTGPRPHREPKPGRRKTSARRRHMTVVQQASQLAAIAGGNQIDRHKPYVYGASPMKLRRPVIERVNAAILSGEMVPMLDEIRPHR